MQTPIINVSNQEFISAIFREDAPWCHVTDFTYDPGAIPTGQNLVAWKGDYFCRYHFQPVSNQYFTISTFYADEHGTARRRKALYRQTHCVVLDDVREKLSHTEAERLPPPSWILETSEGSEQWGYILTEPCTVASRIDNLNDGLIASDLAPSGKDPGQRGVTRYVRLPEGINNKANKLVNGQPFKCRMLSWQPHLTVTLEQLAEPFGVNLDAARREARVDGAADISDHPLINDAGDIINIKEVRSDGRFDITCPWVDEHTGQDDSGSAIFTNEDGTIGFKCHHGACDHRTGADLLRHIEETNPGFGEKFNAWKLTRAFDAIAASAPAEPVPSFYSSDVAEPIQASSTAPVAQPPVQQQAPQADPFKDALVKIRHQEPGTAEQRAMASEFLKLLEESDDKIRTKQLYDDLRDIMHWSKSDLKDILSSLREQWYKDEAVQLDFFNDVVFVMEQNQFYDRKRRLFYTPEAYGNSFADKDPEARKNALSSGMVTKVHRLDYAPKLPAIFEENYCSFANLWVDRGVPNCYPGDISVYLNHFNVLGWGGEPMKHILQWMAYTIRHPDKKINHILLLGGHQGVGKDWILYPLTKAMGVDSKTISGIELLSGFNTYLMSTKHLHLNETELGDHRDAVTVANKLKPLATAPPHYLTVNQKNVKEVQIRNIVNVSMTTNSQAPFRSEEASRRFYALWSDYDPRDSQMNVRPEWVEFWVGAWNWMMNGGAEMVIHYLLNEVDLSDFNPGVAPKVTDFMRDIMDNSKSPMVQTIEDFINSRYGAFGVDIMTAAEMSAELKATALNPEVQTMMHVESLRCTPVAVGRSLNVCRGVIKKRGQSAHSNVRLYVIRNHEKYRDLSPSQLLIEYENQKQANAGRAKFTVV